MGWYCCSCCINKNWSFNKISCIECRHIRCYKCENRTDSISTQTYNLPLRSNWEAEENYDFRHYHVPGCKQADCDGSCGTKNKKALKEQIKLRRDKEAQRRKMEEEEEQQGDEKDLKRKLTAEKKKKVEEEEEEEEESKKRKESTATTATTSSGTGVEVEEPGDTDFLTGAKIQKKKKSGGGTPKGRKKARVTFAEEDVGRSVR
ncbi:MAG: hypothetical protein LQ349_001534 [Xanthoria aureola]|nr:MAG: hypothetical protein LQ349_001534 [Xanthoria aureola]